MENNKNRLEPKDINLEAIAQQLAQLSEHERQELLQASLEAYNQSELIIHAINRYYNPENI